MTDDQKYIEGFNHGYELMKKDPDMAMIIARGIGKSSDPYAKAFVAGNMELLREQELSKVDNRIEEYQKKLESNGGLELGG